MSIAPEKITAAALRDMLDMFDAQPWLTEMYKQVVELWGLCQDREEQALLKKLILSFCMLDAKREQQACAGISDKINSWGLSPASTWIVAVANKTEVDGSTAGLQKLKNKVEPVESWHSRMVGNIPAAVDKVKNGDNIVLFDDFIGSGGTMVKKKNWLLSLLGKVAVNEVKFYNVGFSGMKFGVEHIKATTGDEVFVQHLLLKGISERYPADEAAAMTALMLQLESRLGANYRNKNLIDYSLGYNKSEALYCGQNDNCPNNVFPIFWWPNLKDGNRLNTLLKRAG